MTNKTSFLALLVALIALAGVVLRPVGHEVVSPVKQETTFERVMRTRTLRCSYSPLSPFLTVDPASKQIGGLFHDVMDQIGQRLNLKIDWVEEVGYGQIATGFVTGRYDAFCGVLWATPARGVAMNFSAPLYYNKVHPCVRSNTTEYDQSVEPLNAPDKTIIGYDGDVSLQVARTLFPKAKLLSLPENMPFGEAMQNITTGKADALATCDRIVVDDLNKANANTLKLASPDSPITTIQVALGLPLQEAALKDMIDLAVFDMQADGTLKSLVAKYVGQDRAADTIIVPNVTGATK